MKSLKCLLAYVFSLILGIGLMLQNSTSVFASGKGAWAILTDPNVRWVEYPGSNGLLLYDRETGLIYERSGVAGPFDSWVDAAAHCMTQNYTVNGRQVYGFRLPTVAELTNLGTSPRVTILETDVSTGDVNSYATSELINIQNTQNDDINRAYWGVQWVRNLHQEVNFLIQLNSPVSNIIRALCVRGGGGNHSGDTES